MTLKWTPKEWLNQLAHFSIGVAIYGLSFFVLQFFVTLLFAVIIPFLIVGFIAFLIELYQYFFKDNREPKLDDRIRDWSFYMAGAFSCAAVVVWWI